MMKTKNTKPTQSTQSTKKSVAPVAHNADGAKNRKSSFHSIAWNGDEVALRLPAGLLNRTTMTPEELGHVMVVGETGSGKTASTVKPLLGAMFGYLSNDGLRYSALVVDPKHELLPELRRLDAEQGESRVVELLDKHGYMDLDPFEGVEDFETAADKIEYLFNHFNPGGLGSGDNAIFKNKGLELLHICTRLDQAYYQLTKQGLFTTVCALLSPLNEEPSFFEGLKLFKQGVMTSARYTVDSPEDLGEAKDMVKSEYSVIDLMLKLVNETGECFDELLEPLAIYHTESIGYHKSDKENLRQFGYYVSYWDLMLECLTNKAMTRVFDWDYLYEPSAPGEGPLSRYIENECFMVLSPTQTSLVDELIVSLVKKSVFSLMLTRQNKLAPMAYIADEFQNFISADSHTGEHNFVDRCRSYRVNCVFITQSLAHLKNKVIEKRGQAGDQALEAMLNNMTNRIVFRSTDAQTMQLLRTWIPCPPVMNSRHVIDVRPPSGLKVGECYFITARGEWGRQQVVLPQDWPPLMPRAQQDQLNLHH